MSWAAHEFENYFLQRHVGTKASFLAIVVGTFTPDLVTKFFVYEADDPAQFHRGWPGVGFTHSLITGVVVAVVVLALTRSRSWALGLLIGQWAHVITDVADTAGVMPFFPFSTENVTISMWKHAAVAGRYGDASAYYSSLGGVWDLAWLVVFLAFATRTLRRSYFQDVVVRADPKVWGFLERRLRIGVEGQLLIYRGFLFYGVGRMVSWFLYSRLIREDPLDLRWAGPSFVPGADLSDAGFIEVLVRTAIGGVLFAGFLFLAWRVVVRRLWERADDPPGVERGTGLAAILDH